MEPLKPRRREPCRHQRQDVRAGTAQVRFDSDWPHARAAAAVRDAKSFVQIQMRNICAVIAGTRQPNLRVHVRAVQIHLSAVRMNEVANLADLLFKHAVRGRISHHHGG